jgi:DNA (cytosine-5)-methyltransferase 1
MVFMNFLDLFAGIGGFRLGLEQARHECAGWIEWDPAARRSYEAIHETGGEWNATDIRTVTVEQLPKADIWCGGWPCQDISKNGKGKGLAGNRSGLFFTATRLIEQLEEKDKPKYLFLENVENLLNINRGFDFLRILLELDRIGYDAEWQSINSREHGLPQNRQRLYIIGHFRGKPTKKIFPIAGRASEINLQRGTDGWRVKNATKQGYDIATIHDSVNLAFPDSKTRMGRVGKGYFQTLDRSCNQAVFDPVQQQWRKITPLEAFRIQGFPDWAYERAAAVNKDNQLYAQAGNSVSVNVIYEIAKQL